MAIDVTTLALAKAYAKGLFKSGSGTYGDSCIPSLIGTTEQITPGEVLSSINNGCTIALRHSDEVYGDMVFNSAAWSAAAGNYVVASIVFKMGEEILCAQLAGSCDDNTWAFTVIDIAQLSDIPEDYIPNPETAQVGQVMAVKSVDSTGRPIQWEPVDLPSGGGGVNADDWVKIASVSFATDDEVVRHVITADENGNDFSYDELLIIGSGNDGSGNLQIWFNTNEPFSTDIGTITNFFQFGHVPTALVGRLLDNYYYILSNKQDLTRFMISSNYSTTKGKIQSIGLQRAITTNKCAIAIYGRTLK